MSDPHFEFPRYREFGDIIGDSFNFIIKNFKLFGTAFLTYVMPVLILGTIAMVISGSSLTGALLSGFMDPDVGLAAFGMGFFVMIIAMMIAGLAVYATTFAIIDAYQDQEGDVVVADLWPYVKENIGKLVVIILSFMLVFIAAVVAISVIIGGVMMASAAVGIILVTAAYIVLFYFMFRWILAPYIYVHEEIGVVDAFKRSQYLTKGKWWWTFLTILVMAMISSIVSYVFMIPLIAGMGTSAFLSSETSGLGSTTAILAGLGTLIYLIGSMFASIYYQVGIVLQYYSLREQKEGTGLMDRIDQIDDEDHSGFDNQGEF